MFFSLSGIFAVKISLDIFLQKRSRLLNDLVPAISSQQFVSQLNKSTRNNFAYKTSHSPGTTVHRRHYYIIQRIYRDHTPCGALYNKSTLTNWASDSTIMLSWATLPYVFDGALKAEDLGSNPCSGMC